MTVNLRLDMAVEGCRVIAAQVDELVQPEAFEVALNGVSPYRREKVLAFRFDKDRRLSLLAGLLLDELLRDRGLSERGMHYEVDALGKPRFREFDNLHFSLAHSGIVAAAALGEHPVGVDVECLSGFPNDITDPYTWTAMESVGKLTGEGVGVLVDEGTFEIPTGYIIEYRRIDDYLVCTALRGPHLEANRGTIS